MGKYTSKKNGNGRYHERLAARGISNSQVRMPFIDHQGRKYDTYEGMKRGEGRRPTSE